MAEAIVQTKRCCHCNETKPKTAFWKNRTAADGLQLRCKPCHAQATKKYDQSSKGRQGSRRRSLAFQKTAKGKANVKRQREKYKSKGATRAGDAVKHAVRKGKLPHISTCQCFKCGKQAQHYHHHCGYAKQHRLNVLPVCAVCHKAIEALCDIQPRR